MESIDGRSLDPIFNRLRNIILDGADALTAGGFTMVPNHVLVSSKVSPGAKLAYAMLLIYEYSDPSPAFKSLIWPKYEPKRRAVLCAALIAPPAPWYTGGMEIATVLQLDDLAALDRLCRKQGVSRLDAVNDALRWYIE